MRHAGKNSYLCTKHIKNSLSHKSLLGNCHVEAAVKVKAAETETLFLLFEGLKFICGPSYSI